MSAEELGPLDPDLEALLDAERTAVPPAPALDRVWSRVARGGPAFAPRGARPAVRWLGVHPAVVTLAAFVLGGAGGATLHAALQKPSAARIVYVDRAAAPIASAVPLAPSPAAPPIVPSLPSATPHASGHAPSAPGSSSLAAERALLDEARGALGSGSAGKALALLDDHARRYPHGQLGEEREALAIQALVALGRADEARARAARFRATSPNSLFMPAVDATLASIP
jgi:hypothetical protein